MKALIQRVCCAKVTVDGKEVSSIGKGILVFIGISRDDTEKDVDYIVKKLLSARLFEDTDTKKRWALSIAATKLEILCVSQFTLYCQLKKNKPDFHQSMAATESKKLYEQLLAKIRTEHDPSLVKDGVFGAYMNVSLENDGPVTIEIESPNNSSAGP